MYKNLKNLAHQVSSTPRAIQVFQSFCFLFKARFSHFSSANNFLEGIKFLFPPNFQDLQKTYLVNENCLMITK